MEHLIGSKDNFLDYLAENAPDPDLFARAVRVLGDYLLIYTGSEPYPLVVADELDTEEVRGIISRGFQTRVDRIRFVSASEIAEKEHFGYTEEDFVTSSVLSLRVNRYDDLHDRLQGDDVDKALENFSRLFARPLIFMFAGTRLEFIRTLDAESHMDVNVASVPSLCSHYLYGYALLGDRKGVDEMEPLARLAMSAVPIGELWSEIGTWLVLVK